VLIGCQVFVGDMLYGKMLEHQPAKMQAAEGFWEKQSQSPAPYYWFIVPDQQNQRNRFALGTPYLGSIWLTHSLKGRVEGLKNTPRDRQPTMWIVFYSFRLMVVLGTLMFGEHARMDLVRLAIPRRVYTQSHIEYVVEVILDVWRRRDAIPGYEVTHQAPFLRHFSARLKPRSTRP